MRRIHFRVLLVAALVAVLAWRQWTRSRGAPWVPSNPRDVRAMLELARVGPEDTVYDLGSGDGRVLIEAARAYGARAVGIELDPLRALWSRLRAAALGLGELVRVERADLFACDLSEADVVVCYLQQWCVDALEEHLMRDLRPGTRVVSNRWVFHNLREVDCSAGGRLHLYEV